jgi:plasmid maintenance system antidote protein VapI
MTVSDIAAAMGVDKATIYRRIAAPESFTIGEALRITEILDLPHSESTAIFFAEEVA